MQRTQGIDHFHEGRAGHGQGGSRRYQKSSPQRPGPEKPEIDSDKIPTCAECKPPRHGNAGQAHDSPASKRTRASEETWEEAWRGRRAGVAAAGDSCVGKEEAELS